MANISPLNTLKTKCVQKNIQKINQEGHKNGIENYQRNFLSQIKKKLSFLKTAFFIMSELINYLDLGPPPKHTPSLIPI